MCCEDACVLAAAAAGVALTEPKSGFVGDGERADVVKRPDSNGSWRAVALMAGGIVCVLRVGE